MGPLREVLGADPMFDEEGMVFVAQRHRYVQKGGDRVFKVSGRWCGWGWDP